MRLGAELDPRADVAHHGLHRREIEPVVAQGGQGEVTNTRTDVATLTHCLCGGGFELLVCHG